MALSPREEMDILSACDYQVIFPAAQRWETILVQMSEVSCGEKNIIPSCL